MSRLSVNSLRASLVLFGLALAVPSPAADREKEKPSALIGYTKDQVLSRLGEARSQIKAGAREIMFFPKVKLTFRNGVVVEAEELFDEPAPPNPLKPKRCI